MGTDIPLWADADKFRDWYEIGGEPHLWALNGLVSDLLWRAGPFRAENWSISPLALMAGILALSLVRPWGLVFPNWVPTLGATRPSSDSVRYRLHRVAFLLLYAAWACAHLATQFNDDGIFSP